MKCLDRKFSALVFFLCVMRASGQRSFQNLNFEAANVSGYSGGEYVPVGIALPGWTCSQPAGVVYEGLSSGGTVVALIDANAGLGVLPLQGKYSLCLFSGSFTAASISQTGLVPAGAMSVQMDVQIPVNDQGLDSYAPFTVELGSQQIIMSVLKTYANYAVYGGNVSAFAGDSETLTITQTIPPSAPPSGMELDDILFSPSAVPEPSAWSFLACGASLLGLLHPRRR